MIEYFSVLKDTNHCIKIQIYGMEQPSTKNSTKQKLLNYLWYYFEKVVACSLKAAYFGTAQA